ncbi:uncharacterized protein BO97DRAFT_105018 [Aspergillus homomorphus CBS 101889]|uniref:Uncharacterized protein n=1 Tax=Aspergillus homomorphus (strain CBS 101889) TaxID=1450537 RepID=A0A395HUB2_ASPHC|nr:hypothetical protein BO97DRAFT_105018 [Aspergillus homomorphus CBS 101889]RAL11126.1 hypothetical protein BO97DRAFT_105018 [Aspergillus homomorphus CBS 101889]
MSSAAGRYSIAGCAYIHRLIMSRDVLRSNQYKPCPHLQKSTAIPYGLGPVPLLVRTLEDVPSNSYFPSGIRCTCLFCRLFWLFWLCRFPGPVEILLFIMVNRHCLANTYHANIYGLSYSVSISIVAYYSIRSTRAFYDKAQWLPRE